MQSKSTSKKIECVEATVATRKKNSAAEDRLPITCQIQKQFFVQFFFIEVETSIM